MKHIAPVITVILSLVALAVPAAAQETGPQLAGPFWQLVAINGQPLADGIAASILFDGGRASGSAGCNSFSAAYTRDGASIAFDQAASTLMLCEEARMAVEVAYLTALPLAHSFAIAGAQLTIFDADGNALLDFVNPAIALQGAMWTLQTLNGAPVLTGTTITLSALEDRLAGSAGCNQYTTPFTLEDNRLSLGAIVTTRMACAAAIMQQEAAFVAALEAADSLLLGQHTLSLYDAEGTPLLVFARPDALDGTAWALLALNGEPLPQGIVVTLSFKAGGIGGSGGCNTYGGEYQIAGSALTVPPTIVATMMACAEPAMSIEQAYFAALNASAAYTFDGEQLLITDAAAAELLRFAPAP